MIWNTFLNVHGAKWFVLTDGGKYTKLVKANNPAKTFEYFLNPAAYSGVSAEVVPTSSGFEVLGASELDDRYSVGKNTRLVFGGSNSYPVFDVSPDVSAYQLVEVLTEAKLLPGLVVSFVDKRLASSDQYVMVFPTFWSVLDNIVANPSNYNINNIDQYVLNLLSPNGLLQHFFNFWSFYSSVLYFDTATPTLRLLPDTTALANLYKHDTSSITNEELLYTHNATLNSGNSLLSAFVASFNRTANTEKYSLYPYYDSLGKSLSGAYTIVARPERLIGFNSLVSSAVTSIANNYITDATVKQSFIDLAKQILQEGLKDWFRPSQYRVVVGYQNNTPIYDYVNVFLAFQGGTSSSGVVLVDWNGKQIGVPVIFGDTFSYVDNEFNRAYPQGKQYVTGPHGHIPVYDDQGNIVDWVPDSYAR